MVAGLLKQLNDPELLLMYLAEELPPQDRIELEQRLLVDAVLQRRLQELHATQKQWEDRLAQADERAMLSVSSAGYRAARAMAQWQVERQSASAEPDRAGSARPWRRYAAGAVAAVLIVLLVWSIAPQLPHGEVVYKGKDWRPNQPAGRRALTVAEAEAGVAGLGGLVNDVTRDAEFQSLERRLGALRNVSRAWQWQELRTEP